MLQQLIVQTQPMQITIQDTMEPDDDDDQNFK